MHVVDLVLGLRCCKIGVLGKHVCPCQLHITAVASGELFDPLKAVYIEEYHNSDEDKYANRVACKEQEVVESVNQHGRP